MKKRIQKMMKNEKGLTLVELLAVIVILGIIAAIAIPAIGNIIQNSKEKAVIADAQNTLAAANLYFTENNSNEGAKVNLLVAGTSPTTEPLVGNYLDDAGSLTSATVTKDSSGNKIIFVGEAGSKTITIVGTDAKTKKQLNDKAIYDLFQ